MPFNPSGLLARLFRWTDDRDAGTKILADRMDQEFDNVFSGVNSILNGEQAFLGPVTVPFGTAAGPGVQVDAGMGIYRKSATELGVSIGGVEEASISGATMQVNGSVSANGLVSTDGAVTARAKFSDAGLHMRDPQNSPLGIVYAASDRSAVVLRKFDLAGNRASQLQLVDGDVWLNGVGTALTTGSIINVSRGDARFAHKSHTHDDRYFTEAEINTRFAYKSHTHSQYLPKSGGTMTGAVSMGWNTLSSLGTLDFGGDYVNWETTRGMRFYENGTLVARIGSDSFIIGDLSLQGGRPMHSNRTLGQVGCVIFARSAAPDAKTYGDTVSGSNLTLSDHTGSTISTSIGGTWMCIGYCVAGNSTNFVRIA